MNKVAKIVFEDGTEHKFESGVIYNVLSNEEDKIITNQTIQKVKSEAIIHIVSDLLVTCFDEELHMALRDVSETAIKMSIQRQKKILEDKLGKEEFSKISRMVEELANELFGGKKSERNTSSK